MKKKLSLNNVRQFFTGYGRLFYNKIIGLPLHEQEQIAYRASLCKNDCAVQKYCTVCGCDFPGKIFVPESCNPVRFPDIMGMKEWKEFKIKNKITIS